MASYTHLRLRELLFTRIPVTVAGCILSNRPREYNPEYSPTGGGAVTYTGQQNRDTERTRYEAYGWVIDF